MKINHDRISVSLIQFLHAHDFSVTEALVEINSTFPEKEVSRSTVYRWYRKIKKTELAMHQGKFGKGVGDCQLSMILWNSLGKTHIAHPEI